MRRGTTPTHTFTTDISLVDADVIYLTYQQSGRTLIEISKGDRMEVTENSIVVSLTQEETLRLDPSKRVHMQIRARFSDGTAVACNIMSENAQIILKEGVI